MCQARSTAIASDALQNAVLHLACHCTAQVRLQPQRLTRSAQLHAVVAAPRLPLHRACAVAIARANMLHAAASRCSGAFPCMKNADSPMKLAHGVPLNLLTSVACTASKPLSVGLNSSRLPRHSFADVTSHWRCSCVDAQDDVGHAQRLSGTGAWCIGPGRVVICSTSCTC